ETPALTGRYPDGHPTLNAVIASGRRLTVRKIVVATTTCGVAEGTTTRAASASAITLPHITAVPRCEPYTSGAVESSRDLGHRSDRLRGTEGRARLAGAGPPGSLP